MKESVRREEVEPRQVIGSYTQAWSSRVINTLLREWEAGQVTMPKGFRIKGINMVEKGDGSFIVGFVITKEES